MTDAEGPTDPESEREARREAVEEKYDFEDFGPADMAEMTAEEWEAAFDPESWVTGTALLDRVEQELRARVARREVFAVVERDETPEGGRVVAYSDEEYAVVYPDGSVEGRGTVLRDVKPTVALCSMPDYEPQAVESDARLPDPDEVAEQGSRLGDTVLQVVGVAQVVAGLVLVGAWVGYALTVLVAVVGVAFLLFGVLLLTVVANARLSDRFRSARYRDRLETAEVATDERPAFVPGGGEEGGAPPETGPTSAGDQSGDGAERT
jgi:hypothetical protein